MGARSLLLLALAFSAGGVDAAVYLGLGHAFPANMTGNTVLIAIAVARGGGGDAGHWPLEPALARIVAPRAAGRRSLVAVRMRRAGRSGDRASRPRRRAHPAGSDAWADERRSARKNGRLPNAASAGMIHIAWNPFVPRY